MATRLKMRNDIAANWASENPILAKGELGFLIESGEQSNFKVGDGVTAFADLDYVIGGGGGGSSTFAGLTDKATADIPTINTPLLNALNLKLASSVAASTYQPIITNGSLSLSTLATDPLARGNHTGTQSYLTITGLGTLATQSGTFSGISSGTNTGDQDLSGYSLTSHTHAFSSLTGKPTTLTGYGITDAMPAEYFQRITTLVTANSTAYVNGPDLVIPAGAYDFEIYAMIQAVGETSGVYLNFRCSPTTDVTIGTDSRLVNINALGTGGTLSTSFRNGTGILNAADNLCATYANAPNNYATVHTRGSVVFASTSTVGFKVRQVVTDAVNVGQICIGSFIRFIPR